MAVLYLWCMIDHASPSLNAPKQLGRTNLPHNRCPNRHCGVWLQLRQERGLLLATLSSYIALYHAWQIKIRPLLDIFIIIEHPRPSLRYLSHGSKPHGPISFEVSAVVDKSNIANSKNLLKGLQTQCHSVFGICKGFSLKKINRTAQFFINSNENSWIMKKYYNF